MPPLTNKVILITGAGRGAGKTLAQTLSAEGAVIAAVDISPLLLDQVEEAILAEGGRCSTHVCDMAKKRFVQGALEEVLGVWGSVDILINAGYVDPKGRILELDAWDWQRSLDVNLSGVFYTIQAFGRVAEGESGLIVNIIPNGENLALRVGASALEQLTLESAHELESSGIRVCAISPIGMNDEELGKHALRCITSPQMNGILIRLEDIKEI